MTNTIPSPNMGLPVPIVSVAPGPEWATDINSSLSIIDGHNHSAGSGVQITPAGINISSDLAFNGNNLITARSVRFAPQGSPLSGAGSDIGCLYESGVDLYYNDGNGNQIRITSGGAVSGATGTITGLPSGTASASYSGGTFTFLAATNTPAAMSIGPLTFAQKVVNSKNVTLNTNAAQASNYSVTMPAALPASTNYMTLDASGNISFNANGTTGSGAVTLATNPSFLSGITFTSGPMVDYAEGTWTPTLTGTQNVAAIALSGTARYVRTGNTVFCWVTVNLTRTNGVNDSEYTITLPVAPNNNFSAASQAQGNAVTDPRVLTNTPGFCYANPSSATVKTNIFLSATLSAPVLHSFMYIVNT